jgi:hypothetical protein
MSIRTSIKGVCVVLLPTIMGACGFVFTHGPPKGHEQLDSFSCTESNLGPFIDIMWASTNIIGALVVASDREAYNNRSLFNNANRAIKTSVVWAMFSGAAAATGFRKTKRCRDARRALAIRQAELRDVGGKTPAGSSVVQVVLVSPSADTLAIGEPVQLVATAHGPDGETMPRMFQWSSSNAAIASVHSGLVTAHATGTVVIAAKSDSVVGIASIVVLPPN